jgi:hypothetical protein
MKKSYKLNTVKITAIELLMIKQMKEFTEYILEIYIKK